MYMCIHTYIHTYVHIWCRVAVSIAPPNPPWYGTPPGGPSWGLQAYGESTVWVLLASSLFCLQADPTWRLQGDQEHAPTIGVLAPLPSLPALGRFDLQRSQTCIAAFWEGLGRSWKPQPGYWRLVRGQSGASKPTVRAQFGSS